MPPFAYEKKNIPECHYINHKAIWGTRDGGYIGESNTSLVITFCRVLTFKSILIYIFKNKTKSRKKKKSESKLK